MHWFKKQSILSVVALMLAMVCIFSACGQGASENVLRVGVDDSYPPMEFKDETGKTVGFDIDLANEIGKKLNMKVQFVSTAWSGIFTALEAEKFDCIISSLSITDERKKNMAFTDAYISNAQVIVVSTKNTTINSEKDLKDKIVGVQIGTTAEEACNKFTVETPFKDFKKYEAVIEPFADLKTGRLDAVVVDEVVARYYVNKDKANYKVAGGRLTNEPIGIGFKLKNAALRDKVNGAVKELIKDGTLKSASEKWFGEDLIKNVAQ